MLQNRIDDFVSKPVISLGADDTLRRVLTAMNENNISCIPVLKQNHAIGILTEKGVVELLADNGSPPFDKPLLDIMSSPVISVPSGIYVFDALQVFIKKNIRHLVVTDDTGAATGIVTLSDITNHIGSDLMVEFQTIEHFMSKVVYTVTPEQTLSGTLAEMAIRSISCVIVTQHNKPVGMISERDIIRLASEATSLDQTVQDVMSSPVVCVSKTTQVHEVTRILRKKGIRRVVVTDDRGHVAGLITQTNIMRGLESNYIKLLKKLIREKETELKAASQERDELFQYLVTILDNSIDMAVVATDETFRVVFCNDSSNDILSFPSDMAIGSFVSDIHKHQNIKADKFDTIITAVQEKGSYAFSFEKKIKEKLRYFQARVSIIRASREKPPLGYVFIVQDITQKKLAEKNIRYMAYHDILTGLPNRVAFNERLGLELSHAERRRQLLAIVMIDLDGFKQINDIYGHYTGDQLLSGAAERFSNAIRKSDTIARIGGDEFVVILPDIQSEQNGIDIGNKLIEAMNHPIEIKGVEHTCNISLGISFCPKDSILGPSILQCADKAMYKAKRQGKKNNQSNLCIFEKEP